MYYIGIDLGTSAVKLLLMQGDGQIANIVSREYPIAFPHPGWSEQNPEDWWDAVCAGIPELLNGFDASQVAGIGAGGQMHGLVVLDAQDKVIRPCILWNDGRTQKQVEYLNNVIGKENLSKYTANIAFAGFTAPKLLWMRDTEPENFAKISKIMLPKDYINYKLTGVHCTDYSDASGMLLLDVQHKCWSKEMLDICGVSEAKVPKLFESWEPVGTLTAEAAAKLGLPEGVKVCAGAGDNAAAAQSQAVVLSLAALESHAIDEALEVDISDVAVLSSALTGQLTGIALLHTLQLSFNSLVRNSMDSLFNRQTIVAANLDFGLDSDLDGQGSALSLAGGVNADLRTADRLDAGSLDSLFVSCGEQLVDGVVGKDISAVHLLDQSAGSLALTEAGNSVFLAFLLENIGNSLLESLCVDGELQFCHALLELFTLDEIHLFFLHSKILLRRAGSFCPLQPRTASWMNLLLQYAGTRALNWVQQSRQKLL